MVLAFLLFSLIGGNTAFSEERLIELPPRPEDVKVSDTQRDSLMRIGRSKAAELSRKLEAPVGQKKDADSWGKAQLSEFDHVLLATWYSVQGTRSIGDQLLSNGGTARPSNSVAITENGDRFGHLSSNNGSKQSEVEQSIVRETPPFEKEIATGKQQGRGGVVASAPLGNRNEAPFKAIADRPADQSPQRFNPTGKTINLQVPFKDEEREIGTVQLQIDKSNSLSLDPDGVIPLLKGILSKEVIEQLLGATENGRLTSASFQMVGLDLKFDPGLLELILVTPLDKRKDQVVSLADEMVGSVDLDRPQQLAGYVNIFSGITHTAGSTVEESGGIGAFDQFLIDFDTSLYLFGPVVESEFTYEDAELSGDGELFRAGTRMIADDPARAVRYIGGDLAIPGVGFQDPLDLLGVGIARSLSLQPSRSVRPTGRREFTIERPSSVDVIVNGAVVRRLRFLPGTYDIRDIPLSTGGNQIELIIEDDAGRITRLDYRTFFDLELLAPGVVDFGFGGGINADFGRRPEYYPSEPLVTGFIRTGVLPSLTVGANAQASSKRRQVGFQFIMPTVIGNVGFDAAGSHVDANGFGTAVGVDYRYIFPKNDASNRTFSFAANALSAGFEGAEPREEPGGATNGQSLNETALEFSASYSQSLIYSTRGSLGASYAFIRGLESDRLSLDASLSGSFGRLANWQIGSQFRRNSNSDGYGIDILASVNIPLGANQGFSLSTDTGNNEIRSSYSYRNGASRIGSYGVSLGLSQRDYQEAAVEAAANYVGNRFRAAIDHDTRFAGPNTKNRIDTTRIRAETALAFAGTKIAVGRPISDSFAIITTHPTLDGRDVYLDPSEDGDVAKSDWLGPALVPSIASYVDQRLLYDVNDLPTGYDLGTGAFALHPTYHAGYALEVGSAAAVTVMGTLEYKNGEPVTLLAGQAYREDDDEFEPVMMFSNRVGRFAISGLKPGAYKLKLNTKKEDVIAFEVPETAVGLHRIGKLVMPN